MYTQIKEGKQYSFSLELSSKELPIQNINEMISFFDTTLHKEKEILAIQEKNEIEIPIEIFREDKSGLGAIVCYLIEQKNLTYIQIANLLGRDQRTIWTTYHAIKNSKTKNPNNNKSQKHYSDQLSISTKLFQNRKLSVLETLAMYLLQNHSVKETANLLGKNQMTIWTVKRRAELKLKTIKSEKEKAKNA